jgi:hypothetical protein
MNIADSEFWQSNSIHVLRHLHLYNFRDLVDLLDVFDRDILDKFGEPIGVRKCEQVLFERIAGILPMFIKQMNNHQLIRSFEVCTARGVGS